MAEPTPGGLIETTICNLEDLPTNSNFFVRVYVHRKLKENYYLVGDATGTINITTEKQPRWNQNVIPGQFIKIVKPQRGEELLHLQLPPLYSPAIEYLPVDNDDTTNQPMYDTFDQLCTKPIYSMVNVVAKVCFVTSKKPVQYSTWSCTVGLKDIAAQRHILQIFGDHCDAIQVGAVYEFNGLKVQNFKGPMDTWNRLGTVQSTKIKVASTAISTHFAHIPCGDGWMTGTIVGFKDARHYTACPKCQRKCTSSPCTGCEADFPLDNLVHDFYVELLMETSKDFESISCFRKSFKNVPKIRNLADVTKFAESITGQKFCVDYIEEKDMHRYRVVTMDTTNLFVSP